MPVLYHFWSSPESQRVRLALACKGIDYEDHPLRYDDDETFFALGTQRGVPILRLDDGTMLTDSITILHQLDTLFPDTPPLVTNRINDAAWDALLAWRKKSDAILRRLYAPLKPAYRDIGAEAHTLQAYKLEVMHHFGMSVEELANDRYTGYAQLERMTQLQALSQHLSRQRFYLEEISIADMLLTADLYPLQLLDGVSFPLDLMYYFTHVEQHSHIRLDEGLISPP